MYEIDDLAYSQRTWLKSYTRDIEKELHEQKEHKEEFWYEFPKNHWSPACLGDLVAEVSKNVSIDVQFRHRELKEYLVQKCLKIYDRLTRHEAFKKLKYWFNSLANGIAQSALRASASGVLAALFEGSPEKLKALAFTLAGGVLIYVLERLLEIFRDGESLTQIIRTAKQFLLSLTNRVVAKLLVNNRKDVALFKFSPA